MKDQSTKLDKIIQQKVPLTTPQFQKYVKKAVVEVLQQIAIDNPRLKESIEKYLS